MSAGAGVESPGGHARAGARAHPRGTRFVLAAHEDPDGDALGSLVGMQGLLTALGKDSVMFIAATEFPLPLRVPLLRARRADPRAARGHRRAHRRLPRLRQHRPQSARACCARAAHLLNIDHHHDNTRFGTLNHVVADASCTAEIVWDLMPASAWRRRRRSPRRCTSAWSPTPGASCTRTPTPRAHEMAAELIAAGVDVHGRLPPPLRGDAAGEARAARARAQRDPALHDGELTCRAERRRTSATPEREDSTRRASSTTCARCGHQGRGARPRADAGERGGGSARSRCARPTTTSTSRRSPASQGGGGHRRAAGFSTTSSSSELIEFLRGDRRAAAAAPTAGRHA